MKIQPIDIFYLYGVVFVLRSIYGIIYSKKLAEKIAKVLPMIKAEGLDDLVETKKRLNEEVKKKGNISNLFNTADLVWIIGGLFSDEKLLFLGLGISFILVIITTLMIKQQSHLQLKIIIQNSFEVIIVILILYSHYSFLL